MYQFRVTPHSEVYKKTKQMESLKYSVNALPKMAAHIVYRSQRRKMADKAIFELSIISLEIWFQQN